MRTKNKDLIKKGSPLPLKNVEQYMKNWHMCLPIQLGDLFTFTEDGFTGTKRYDTYTLKPRDLNFILNLYNGVKKYPKNIKNLGVIMGKKINDKGKKVISTNPSNDIFVPILEVSLFKKVNGQKVYCFEMFPEKSTFAFNSSTKGKSSFSANNLAKDLEESISPKVAELFIVKWQSIGDAELISAFDCLAPEGIRIVPTASGQDENLFLQQKLQRVKKYTFSKDETSSIFDTIIELYSSQVIFKVYLGAGLTVADYHPFSFRPIIAIEQMDLSTRSENMPPPVTYYDTSRPCPPYCGNN